MIIRSQNIDCDVFTQTAKPVHFVQGEKGREIMFTFVNSAIPIEDEPQPIPLSGLTATIHILKPDGNFIIDNMTIQGNAALYTLTENACAAGGAGVYDVSLSRGSDVIYTAHGAFVGDFRAISDDVVNSVSEAYGVTFPEGFQEKLIAGAHITIEDNVISSEGERYTAGDNVQISEENVISATDTRYTAGDNVQISQQNVISATDTRYTAGDGIQISQQNVISATGGITKDVLYENSVGAIGQISLEDSVLDYDAIYVECKFNSNQYFTNTIMRETLTHIGTEYISLASYVNVYVGITTNSTPTSFDAFGSGVNGITKIIGIKY